MLPEGTTGVAPSLMEYWICAACAPSLVRMANLQHQIVVSIEPRRSRPRVYTLTGHLHLAFCAAVPRGGTAAIHSGKTPCECTEGTPHHCPDSARVLLLEQNLRGGIHMACARTCVRKHRLSSKQRPMACDEDSALPVV